MLRWPSSLLPPSRTECLRWVPAAALFSCLSILLFTLVVLGTLSLQAQQQRSTLRTQDVALVDSASRLLSQRLQEVHTDLRTWAHTALIQRVAAEPHNPGARTDAARFMRNVGQEAQIYDQLRFIDVKGMEQIRIDLQERQATIVPDPSLQDKSGRYFFQEAMRLQAGEIYMSPLDLNVEHGQVEQPLKPMVRLATPLFDDNGQRLGILIVNVLGEWLIQEFRQLMPPHRDAVWLNAQGDWLVAPDSALAWGFMFARPGAFTQSHPLLWQAMRAQPQGSLVMPDGMWTYTTLHPLNIAPRQGVHAAATVTPLTSSPNHAYRWILATRIPTQHLPSSSIVHNPLALTIYLCGVLLLLGFSLYLAKLLHSRKQLRHEAATHVERLQDITAVMAEGLIAMNPRGEITFVNPEAERLLGWRHDQLMGQDGHALFHHHTSDGREAPHDTCPIRAVSDTREVYRSEDEVFFHQDGRAIPVGVSAAPLVNDGVLEGTVMVFSDLSQVKAYQAEIQQLAFHDALTGVPNRRLLKDRLAQSMGYAHRHQRHLALMYIDLDHFKQVNDTLGHDGGDDLLRAVATRLVHAVRATDTVARIGGDEFVVLLPEVSSAEAAAEVAQHILDALQAPVSIKGHTLMVGVSIGVALFPHAADDITTLMKAADQAMYTAKQSGRRRYHVFVPELLQGNASLEVA